MKFLIKLALAAMLGYAAWHVGLAYASDYRLRDGVRQAALAPRITDDQLYDRILTLAEENDAPLEDGTLEIRRAPSHIYVDVAYTRPVDVLPWYRRAWPFTWTVDVVALEPMGFPTRPPGARD